ncbi:MAG: hypothetical protein ACRC9L_09505 [Brevinema sp.]
MKHISFLLCGVFVITSLHGQQQGTEPLEIPSDTQIQEVTDYDYNYNYNDYSAETNSGDYNNIDISQFLINPTPGSMPPMPPSLTNSPEDILSFIRRNFSTFTNSNILGLPTNAQVAQPPRFEAPYSGMIERYPPKAAVGVWWRYYAQNTSIFNIPAASEELLVVAENGDVVWLQNIKTSGTVQSKSQRRLSLSVYEGFGGISAPLWVFYYPSKTAPGADPAARPSPRNVTNTDTVFNQPSYFVRIFPDQGFMQMSKNPNFPHDQTMYWRHSPRVIPEILVPPPSTNEIGNQRPDNANPSPDSTPQGEDYTDVYAEYEGELQ